MSGNYSITVTDGSGCQATVTTTIAGLDSIRINFIADRPSCNGLPDGGIGINQITGGVGFNENDYRYVWENGDTTLVRTGIPGGLIYAVTVTDSQGCTGVQSRLLADPPPITFDLLVTTPNCFGEANGSLTLSNLNSPNGMLSSIQWDNAAGNQTTVTASNLAAGTYGVTVTDGNNCTASATALLDQPPALSAAFTVMDNTCFGYADGAIRITTSGGVPDYSYQWSNGAVGPTLTNLNAGAYAVTVSDSRGCQVVLLPAVAQPASFTASAETEPSSCFGLRDGRITVVPAGGAPPFRYSIDNVNFSASNVLLGLAGGNYTLFIRDASGCQFNLATTVGEPAEFSVDAGPDLRITYGDSIELAAVISNAQGSVSLVWNPPYPGSLSCELCPNPVASPEYTLDYQLLAYDENDCEASDILRVFVDKPKLAVVPTGFTPNNDGYNDLLLVHGWPGTQVLSFQVFDRWGEQVYTASDFPANQTVVGWDGSFRGQPLNGGVFVWLLVVRHLDGTEESYQGQTTLIR
jgi:gliding motility-associated-like protein